MIIHNLAAKIKLKQEPMYQVLLVGVFMCLFHSQISSQEKQSLSESAYFNWNAIENPQISNDGTWAIYELNPNKGDGSLVILNTTNQKEIRVQRGHKAYFDELTSTLVCLVHHELALMDSLKKKKVKEKDLPGDTLLLWNLMTNQKQSIPDVKSLKTPDKWGGSIAYELRNGGDSIMLNKLPRKPNKDESTFIVQNLEKNAKDTFPYIKSIVFAEEAPIIYLNQNATDSSRMTHVQFLDLKNESRLTVFSGLGKVKNLGCLKDGLKLCCLQDPDTSDHAVAIYDQYIWTYPDTAASLILKGNDPQIPEDWIISEHFQSYFSPDMHYLFLGAAPTPLQKDTTLIPDDVVDLEIWHYQDQALYTEQEVQEKTEKIRSYLLGFNLEKQSVVAVASREKPTIKIHPDLDLAWAIGLDDLSKRMALSWEGRVFKDAFLVSLLDGTQKLIKENITGNPDWSPGGQYIYWYEEPDTTWYVYSIKEKKLINLTENNVLFSDELNDLPDFPNSYGLAGWSKDDEKMYLYDRYDIWEAAPRRWEKHAKADPGSQRPDSISLCPFR
ncbi:MAG: hypothetical protein IPL46_11375 [Saprospiraceae bacterium]|nr:hypothetical protein [Saprospiraceae bacterium]